MKRGGRHSPSALIIQLLFSHRDSRSVVIQFVTQPIWEIQHWAVDDFARIFAGIVIGTATRECDVPCAVIVAGGGALSIGMEADQFILWFVFLDATSVRPRVRGEAFALSGLRPSTKTVSPTFGGGASDFALAPTAQPACLP